MSAGGKGLKGVSDFCELDPLVSIARKAESFATKLRKVKRSELYQKKHSFERRDVLAEFSLKLCCSSATFVLSLVSNLGGTSYNYIKHLRLSHQ